MADSENTKPFYNSTIPSDWEVKTLGELTTLLTNGFVGKAKDHYVESGDGVLYIQGYNITESGFNQNGIKKVSKSFHEKNSKSCLKEGDLLTIQTGQIGLTSIVPKELSGSNCHALVISRFKRDTSDPYFFLHYFNSEIGVKKFKTIETGSTMKHLNVGDMYSLELPLPPLPEQKAIAHVLGLMDSAINQNNQLIAQKELRKKWLMQNLLTGKKRLKGFENTIWRTKKLETVLIPISRPVDKPESSFLALGIRSHGKGTFLKYDFEPAKIEMETLFVVRENDLIVNITFAWEGAIAIVKKEDDGALVSHRFPTFMFNHKTGVVNFFRHLILQSKFKYMMDLISPGGAGRNRVLSKKDFLKLEVKIPEVEEQTAIAQVLQAADKEIQLLKTKTEKLREQKKGMMQQLLTGKKRLKIRENEKDS